MESAEIYRNKLKQFEKAVSGFDDLMKEDTSALNLILADGVKNGRIQKFEYCSELMWKTVRLFLLKNDGATGNSPKAVVKEFHLAGYGNDGFYESLIEIIEDRNLLSHVYRESIFEQVYANLDVHLSTLQKLISILNQ